MRSRVALGVAAAVLFAASCYAEEELKSGLPVGKTISAFDVVKCGGADDGVKVGAKLCYVWKLGGQPVVLVFTKETGDALTSLAKEIDKVVEENKSKKLFAVINLIGEDKEQLEETAKKVSEPFKNIAFAVPVETELGPKNYGVNPDAGITVMVYNQRKILANHAVAPGKLTDKKIKEIGEDAAKAVKK